MRKYLNLSFVLVALMLVPTAFYSSDAQAYGAIFGKFISKAFKNGSRQVIKNAEKVAKSGESESIKNLSKQLNSEEFKAAAEKYIKNDADLARTYRGQEAALIDSVNAETLKTFSDAEQDGINFSFLLPADGKAMTDEEFENIAAFKQIYEESLDKDGKDGVEKMYQVLQEKAGDNAELKSAIREFKKNNCLEKCRV